MALDTSQFQLNLKQDINSVDFIKDLKNAYEIATKKSSTSILTDELNDKNGGAYIDLEEINDPEYGPKIQEIFGDLFKPEIISKLKQDYNKSEGEPSKTVGDLVSQLFAAYFSEKVVKSLARNLSIILSQRIEEYLKTASITIPPGTLVIDADSLTNLEAIILEPFEDAEDPDIINPIIT